MKHDDFMIHQCNFPMTHRTRRMMPSVRGEASTHNSARATAPGWRDSIGAWLHLCRHAAVWPDGWIMMMLIFRLRYFVFCSPLFFVFLLLRVVCSNIISYMSYNMYILGTARLATSPPSLCRDRFEVYHHPTLDACAVCYACMCPCVIR